MQRLAANGVAVVLVEQSVNVALTVAERAYFMERGTIRFSGPSQELLQRPDLLRSVFLTGIAEPTTGTDTHAARALSTNGDGHETAPLTTTSTRPVAPSDRPVALQVDDLVRSFGGIRAVDGVTFDVREHEIVGVIGPNGAGKTTVFDLVSGFIPLDSGRVMLNGRDVTRSSPSSACCGRARPQLPGCCAVRRDDGARNSRGGVRAMGGEPQRDSPPPFACRRSSTTSNGSAPVPTN